MLNIIFDLDDTLYDTAKPFFQVLDRYLPERGCSDARSYALFREHCDIAFELFAAGKLTLAESHVMRTQGTFAELGQPLDAENAYRFQLDYQSMQGKIQLSSAMTNMLDELKNQNASLSIFTNGPEKHQMMKYEALGLERWVPRPRVFISGSIGYAKPHPEAFAFVEKALPAAKEEILFIGDSLDNDIIGGQNAGWSTLWFNHRRQDERNGGWTDLTVHSITEMHAAINEKIQSSNKGA